MSSNNTSTQFPQSNQVNPAKRKLLDQDQSQSPVQKQVKLENGGPAPLQPHRNMFNPQGQQGQQGQQPQQIMYPGQQGGVPQGGHPQQQQPSQQAQQQQQSNQAQQIAQVRLQILQNLNEEDKKKYTQMMAHYQKVLEEHGHGSPQVTQMQQRLNQMTKFYYQQQQQQRAQANLRAQQAGVAATQQQQQGQPNPTMPASAAAVAAASASAGARPIAPGTAATPQTNLSQFQSPPGLEGPALQKWKEQMENKVKQLIVRLQTTRKQMTQVQAALAGADGAQKAQLQNQLTGLVRQYKLYKDWIDGFRHANANQQGGDSSGGNQTNITGQSQHVVAMPAAPQDGTNIQGTGASSGDSNHVINKQPQSMPQTAASTPIQQQNAQPQFQNQHQQQPPQKATTGLEQSTPNMQQHASQVSSQAPSSFIPNGAPHYQQFPPGHPSTFNSQPLQGHQGQQTTQQPPQQQLTSQVPNRPPTATSVRPSMTPTAQTPQQSPIQQHQSPQLSPQLSQQPRPGAQTVPALVRSPVPGTPVVQPQQQQRDPSVPSRAASTQPSTRPQTAVQQPQPQPQQQQRPAGVQSPPPAGSAFIGRTESSTSQATASKMPIPKTLMIPPPQPVPNHPIRPSLSGNLNSAGSHVMGAPALVKNPAFDLDEGGMGLLSKRKLEELVKQIDPDEKLDPEVEEVCIPNSNSVTLRHSLISSIYSLFLNLWTNLSTQS